MNAQAAKWARSNPTFLLAGYLQSPFLRKLTERGGKLCTLAGRLFPLAFWPLDPLGSDPLSLESCDTRFEPSTRYLKMRAGRLPLQSPPRVPDSRRRFCPGPPRMCGTSKWQWFSRSSHTRGVWTEYLCAWQRCHVRPGGTHFKCGCLTGEPSPFRPHEALTCSCVSCGAYTKR